MSLPEPDITVTPMVEFNIRTFAKLRKYANIIKNDIPPSKEAIKRTIQLLDASNIQENGQSISSSSFIIRKNSDAIIVKIGGFDVIQEYSLVKYHYLRHPAIELMATMLEHGKAFLNLENQFNKSILKRI